MRHILIVGGDGKVGGALAAHLRNSGTPVLCTSRRRESAGGDTIFLDLAQPGRWIPPDHVKVAILCAALATIEVCRNDPQGSRQINVTGLLEVARKLHARDVLLVYLSTNAVFDGTKPLRQAEEPTCPMTEYGRQKADAERLLQELDPTCAVVRFAKILDPSVPLFAQWMKTLRDGQAIEPFSDMSIAPVPMSCAVSALRLISDGRRGGIYQVSAERDISYAQIALWAAECVGAERSLVRPVSALASGRVTDHVAKHTTLAIERLVTEFGMTPPPAEWSIQQALRDAAARD